MSDSTAVNRAVEVAVERFGGLDVVSNDAGVGCVGRASEVSDHDWRKVMGVDLDGVLPLRHAAMPHLVEAGGNVVNTASISGFRGDTNMLAYDTPKGAVVNFTRATAVDYDHDGVRVNAVYPGPVRTAILGEALKDEDISQQYSDRNPLGHVAEPEDIAAVITF